MTVGEANIRQSMLARHSPSSVKEKIKGDEKLDNKKIQLNIMYTSVVCCVAESIYKLYVRKISTAAKAN